MPDESIYRINGEDYHPAGKVTLFWSDGDDEERCTLRRLKRGSGTGTGTGTGSGSGSSSGSGSGSGAQVLYLMESAPGEKPGAPQPRLYAPVAGHAPEAWEASGPAWQCRVTADEDPAPGGLGLPAGEGQWWVTEHRARAAPAPGPAGPVPAGPGAAPAPPLRTVTHLLTLSPENQPPAYRLGGRDLVREDPGPAADAETAAAAVPAAAAVAPQPTAGPTAAAAAPTAAAAAPATATPQATYFTDDTPAADLPRRQAARKPVRGPLWRWISYALVLGFVALVLLDPHARSHPRLDFVRLAWYVGLGSFAALFLRRLVPFRRACHLLAAGFLLHLHTLIADHVLREAQITVDDNLAGYRIAGLVLLLLLLDLLAPRWYAIVSHASLWSGSLLLFFYSLGFAIHALVEGQWSGYAQHLGELPQGLLWPLMLAGFLWWRERDYRQVPLTADQFFRLLRKLEKGLTGSVTDVRSRAPKLSYLASRLHRAFAVSDDPRVLGARALGNDFLRLSTLLGELGKLDPARIPDPALAETDLRVLRDDLGHLRAALERGAPGAGPAGPARGQPAPPLPRPRLSPQLRAAVRPLDP
jgi:hypothetical protein